MSSTDTTTSSWFLAARPKTLPAAIAPVWIGTVLAFNHPSANLWWSIPILLAAILIQIGTNVANDYHDYKKGADTPERVGPVRVTQSGLLRPEQVRRGYFLLFSLAILVGVPLAVRGGWWIVAIGLVSCGLGVLYTAGPLALAYRGWAEPFVILFFGVIAVSGTTYLLTLEWTIESAIAGIAPGMLATSLLVVNNMRDIPTDRKTGKFTLAAQFGTRFAQIEYTISLLLSFVVIGYLLHDQHRLMSMIYFVPALFISIVPLREIWSGATGAALNGTLAKTALVQMFFSFGFGLAWLVR